LQCAQFVHVYSSCTWAGLPTWIICCGSGTNLFLRNRTGPQ
jgi:hypothetical protein